MAEHWERIKSGQYQRGDLVWAHVERGDASGWWCTCAGRGGRRSTLREAKKAARPELRCAPYPGHRAARERRVQLDLEQGQTGRRSLAVVGGSR